MNIKNIIDEDCINYKKVSMFIAFPYCNFKCCIENGTNCCQNSELAKSPNVKVSIKDITKRYLDNPITSALVMGGLEPMDSWKDLSLLVDYVRRYTQDDIIIYTGYYLSEIKDKIEQLKQYSNIVIKFGRYIPNQEKHFDEVLGVDLASPNQHAVKIS